MTSKKIDNMLAIFNSFERNFVIEYNKQEVLITENNALIGSIYWSDEPTESEKISSIYSLVLELQMQ